jgi:uncharacterized protein YbjT (DUF2867 family)
LAKATRSDGQQMTTGFRESVLLVGASGRTGRAVLRYLSAASVPVIACVRRADRLPEPRAASVEVAVANLEHPHALAPLIERAAHVIYLAGGDRRSLSPGAWQLEVETLSAGLEMARRSGLPGRWIYVGYSGAEQRGGTTWAEARWRELKVAAEEAITGSGVNYFVLRTGVVTEAVSTEPRVALSQGTVPAPTAEIPCNALGFLLTGAALAGAAHRSRAVVRVDLAGTHLQAAVQAFSHLRTDGEGSKGDLREPARTVLGRR